MISLKVRKFSKEDHKDIVNWWNEQDFPALPIELLSPNGFIVEDEEEKIAATWVYRTDSPIYIMEWTVGNPSLDFKKRGAGLDLLIDNASTWAKEDGALLLFTMAEHKRLISRLENKNFTKTDENMTHFMRRL